MRGSDAPVTTAPREAVFLPDLCGLDALLVVVVVSELAALVIVVAATGFGPTFLNDLALVSFYAQWLGLSCSAALCLARRPLHQASARAVSVICFALILAVAWLVAELAWWVVNPVVGAGALIGFTRAELLARTVSISALVGAAALRYFYVQFHWRQRMASEALARLEALQARIRPHFFFNCMNTIASLTRSDPAVAERAVEDLADLFRASLADAKAPVPFAEELAFVERYLNIERLRLGARLAVEWDLAPMPPGARLPLLSLQPIVENAIYHGIEPARAGGVIAISAAIHDGLLDIVVTNPLNDGANAPRQGNRIALDNVRQRLRAHFGAAATLSAGVEGERYVVHLVVPLRAEGP